MNARDKTQASPSAAGASNPPANHEWRVSKDGQPFDMYADWWQLNSRASVNVSEVRRLLPASLRESAMRTFAHYAETCSSGTVKNSVKGMRDFLRFAGPRVGTDTISLAAVASYRHFRFERSGDDRQVSSRVRPFLKKWFSLGYPGVSRELVEEIASWRLKAPEKGAAVNTLDANKGPLMPDELGSLQLVALAAFERGDLSLENFSLLRLLIATGRRPLQVSQVKLGDMDDSRFEDPEPGQEARRVLLLKLPRVKKDGGQWRERFRSVPLTPDLWNLLAMQRRSVLNGFDELLARYKFAPDQQDLQNLRDNLPLFPMWSAVEQTMETLRSEVDSARGKAGLLLPDAASDTWHYVTQGISDAFARIARVVHATNRSGDSLAVYPRRLRYTYQFRLEQAGCPPAVIAWNMDHSDIQSLRSYSKNGPDKARTISKTMALGLAPFVKVFQGKVVANEESAEGGQSPAASRVLIDGSAGATCATLRGCGMNALPRPCYAGCPHFRPWVDGPHEQFLEAILQERQRDLEAGVSNEVITANDQLILGIAQVIQLCEQQRKETAEKAAAPTRKRKTKRRAK